METIGVKELRDNLSRILKKVASGEVIRVLRHGRDMVELRPLVKNSEQELLSRLKEKNLLEGRGIRVIGSIKTVKDLIAEDRR